jgi:hypothetical protein
MPHRLAPPEQRRQTALLLGLSVAVVASLAFSEYLTRTVLGLAAFWPANALLAAGLVTLNGSRRLSLSIVFVVFHLCIDMLVGDSPGGRCCTRPSTRARPWPSGPCACASGAARRVSAPCAR